MIKNDWSECTFVGGIQNGFKRNMHNDINDWWIIKPTQHWVRQKGTNIFVIQHEDHPTP